MSDLMTAEPAATMQSVVSGAVNPPTAGIQREVPADIPAEVTKNVEQICAEVRADKARWKDTFDRMRYDVKFAAGKNQWPNQKKKEQRYIANITGRHIEQRVAAVYAKNPTFVVKRRERVKFKVWDGNVESYQLAQNFLAAATAAGVPPPQGAIALMADVEAAAQEDAMLDKIGETGRIMLNYFVREQVPDFKKGMKRTVRRAKTVSVGFVRMGFQRVNGKDPKDERGIIDSQRRLEFIEQVMADVDEGKIDKYCADAEQLKQAIKVLQAKQEIVLREGLVFDFPDSTRVIPHRRMTQLDGFIGADWVTIEHVMTLDRVKQVYKKDVSKGAKVYNLTADGRLVESKPVDETKGAKSDPLVLVWQHYHRPSGVMYTVVEGYGNYLEDPQEPDVDLERFYPIYPYITGENEDEDDPYPVSDVKKMEPIQVEFNRRREAEKQHRIANRPLYVAAANALVRSAEEGMDDMKSLARHQAHAIVEVQGLLPGQKAGDLIQALEKIPIDPQVYETETVFSDGQRVVGSQEVDFGSVSGATATEVGVADSKRLTSEQEDVDSLDMLLSDIARDAFQIMAREVSEETAKRIAGPGAVWPSLSRQEIAEELYLDVEAGSSGRPNQWQEINKLKEMGPTVQQTPGINPSWWAKKVVRTIDPAVDLSEAVTEGLPSMLAINKQTQPAAGPDAETPEQQGEEGGNNAVKAGARPPGGSPAFPGPNAAVA